MCGFTNLSPQKAARTKGRGLGAASPLAGARPLVGVIKAKASDPVAAKVAISKEARLHWSDACRSGDLPMFFRKSMRKSS